MIEAVNSTLANAQLVRGVAEQSDAARSYAANPDKIQEAAAVPQAPYVSPYISVDVNYNKAVLQIRDSETGDVVRQFPSETRLKAQQHSASLSKPSADPVPKAEEDDTGETGGTDTARAQISSQAQIASQALAAGQKAGVESLSAGVSVLA